MYVAHFCNFFVGLNLSYGVSFWDSQRDPWCERLLSVHRRCGDRDILLILFRRPFCRGKMSAGIWDWPLRKMASKNC